MQCIIYYSYYMVIFCCWWLESRLSVLVLVRPVDREGKWEKFSRAQDVWGAPPSCKNWKMCSRWLTSNMYKIHFWPRLHPGPHWGAYEVSPKPLVGWWGDISPYLLLSTSWVSRSRRLQDEVVIGPCKHGFLGPTAALDGPGLGFVHITGKYC